MRFDGVPVPERLVFERDGYLASEAGMSFWCLEFL